MSEHPAPSGSGASERFDEELDLRWIAAFVGGIVGLAAFSFVAMFGLSVALKARSVARDPAPGPLPEARQPRPRPRAALQADPAKELAELLAKERTVLSSYGWIDREAGVARIPVTRAMDLIVESGLPEPAPLASLSSAVPASTPAVSR